MWFFKQAQQVSPTPQRETEERIHPRGREVVHAVEKVIETVERVAEEVVEKVAPAAERVVDIVRPLERKAEEFIEEKIEHLIDKKGWWKEE